MKKKSKLKVVKIIGIIIAVIVLIAAVSIPFLITRPWTQVSGKLEVKGLLANVTIIRDKWGIPNIYAENDHDLFFAQGYVHAQDRLYQLEIHHRLGNGNLSEMVGKPGVGTDKAMRVYGTRRIAEKSYSLLDDDIKAQLQAYCDGINAYIDTHKDKLPVEFIVLNIKPSRWTPIDSLSFGNVLALLNAVNFSYELFRAQMIAKLGEKMTEDALPPWDEDNPEIITKDLEKYSWRKNILSRTSQTQKKDIIQENYFADKFDWLKNNEIKGTVNLEDYITGASTFGWASGAWAVSGKYTESGKPILACDVHMGLNIPSVWYEIGMHGGRFDISGFSVPGEPLILLGHNKDISWGFVNLNPDVQDLYMEKLDNPENPRQYLYMGKWYDLEKKKEIINVKGRKPEILDLMFTRHGPLVNDLVKISKDDLKDFKNKAKFAGKWSPLQRDRWEGSEPLALRWAVHDGCISIKSIFLFNQARNWDEFRNALSYWDNLGESFIYADNQGNIGYQSAAKIPIRNPKHLGTIPVPGWTGEYEWKGYIPFNLLPNLYNPPTGFVATANNKTVTDAYPYKFTYDWFHPGYRARSLVHLLSTLISNRKPITIEDMEKIQGDNFSYTAQTLNKYLAALKPDNDLEAKVLDYAGKWDARYDLNSVGASIYSVWYSYMDVNTYNDELEQKKVWGFYLPLKHIQSLVKIISNANNPWFDNVFTTDKIETRNDIAKISLKEAIKYLAANYGNDPSKWTLDKVQTVNLKHQILGNVPVIGMIFNSLQTLPFAGSPTSIAFAFSYNSPPLKYNIAFAANERHIVPLENPDNTQTILSSGESAQIFNPHREDQMKLWAELKYHTMPFSKERVEKAAVNTLLLIPSDQKE